MLSAYLFCGILGLAWTVANFALGKVLGGDGGGSDGGHVEVSHEFGVDDGGHGSAMGDDGGGGLHLPLFSPTALAGYLTGFGATGLVLMAGLGVTNPFVHVPISLAGAAALGVSVAALTVKLMRVGETSSEARLSQLAGRTGELTVGIPAGGLGELAYLAGGVRSSAAARTADGSELARGTQVRIVRVEGATFVVAPLAGLPAGAKAEAETNSPARKERA